MPACSGRLCQGSLGECSKGVQGDCGMCRTHQVIPFVHLPHVWRRLKPIESCVEKLKVRKLCEIDVLNM